MSAYHEFRPTLELLEDRSTPAAVGGFDPASAAATAAGSQVVAPVQTQTFTPVQVVTLGQTQGVSATPQTQVATQQPQAAPAVIDLQNGVAQAVGRGAVQAALTTLSPANQLAGLGPVNDTGATSPTDFRQSLSAQAVLSFQGRFALPGTGVEQRVGVGNGPLTQPPGLFLVGGGNDQPNLLGAQPTARPVVLQVLNEVQDGSPDRGTAETASLALPSWSLADPDE